MSEITEDQVRERVMRNRGYNNMAWTDFTAQMLAPVTTSTMSRAREELEREQLEVSTTEEAGEWPDYQLGDRVQFTGTVTRSSRCGRVRYAHERLPGFDGYRWGNDVPRGESRETRRVIGEGLVIGRREYKSMENDEGIWVPDKVQEFTGYLVAYHLRRKPVIVLPRLMEGVARD